MLGDVLRTYASNELTRAFDCLAWRGARFHAGVHQARKSLRCTRASLALDARARAPGGMLIDRELRRINRSLSVLRDARAVVATLERLAKEHNAAGSSSLLQRARHIAVQKRLAQARGATILIFRTSARSSPYWRRDCRRCFGRPYSNTRCWLRCESARQRPTPRASGL